MSEELRAAVEMGEYDMRDEEYEVVDMDEYRESYQDYISSYIY